MTFDDFLGSSIFIDVFIPNAARIQAPLNKLFVGARRKDKRVIKWLTKVEHAFKECKQQLSNILVYPKDYATLALKTDASDFAIIAALEQFANGKWELLGFFSRKLDKTQRKYSAYDRELFAIYKSIKFFRYTIEGRDLIIKTDHKPLTFAFL